MKVRAALLLPLLLLAIDIAVSAQNPAANGARSTRRTTSIAGRIIQTDGTAADGARVAVYAMVEGAPAGMVGMTTSAHDGRYEVTGIPAGEFTVGATPLKAGGFGGDSSRPRTVPVETLYPGVIDRDRAGPITVFDGVPVEGIDVWLTPEPQRFAMSGRISWPDGVEVNGLVIEYGGPNTIRRGIWYVSDPGGLFTIEGVAQGSYVLLARGETRDGPLMGLVSTDVALGSVEDIRVTLRLPGSIEGRIVIEGTAKTPLGDLHVTPVHTQLTLSPVYPVEDATIAGDGAFQLTQLIGEYAFAVRGLPPGWRIRRVTRAGRPLPADRIVVGAGERATGVEIVVGMGPT